MLDEINYINGNVNNGSQVYWKNVKLLSIDSKERLSIINTSHSMKIIFKLCNIRRFYKYKNKV